MIDENVLAEILHNNKTMQPHPLARVILSNLQTKTKVLTSYTFEGGAAIEVKVFGDIDTQTAIDMLDTLIAIKREEIARKTAP